MIGSKDGTHRNPIIYCGSPLIKNHVSNRNSKKNLHQFAQSVDLTPDGSNLGLNKQYATIDTTGLSKS